ncbi:MAG: hypothetical protein CL583_13270 [Alteromonadaceae bacterium]|nr:hypothetical protein [Alteromonadaceae bacterium]|tara:strand:+ start:239 stop:751 length:513 start_codon:yes stop_codon:yes gene_type:complete
MADPVSLTLMAAGTAMSAYGSVAQGAQAEQAGKDNRDAAYAEAEYREQQAEQEVAVASVNNARIAKRMKEILSTGQAKAAAGGGSSQDATSVAFAAENARTSILDMMREMASAEGRAKQIEYGADVTRREGDMAYAEGKAAKRASYISAGATILQGASSWYDKFGNNKDD